MVTWSINIGDSEGKIRRQGTEVSGEGEIAQGVADQLKLRVVPSSHHPPEAPQEGRKRTECRDGGKKESILK